MNIEEYADILNLELEIRRYPNQDNRYTAKFEHCEIKDDASDGFLRSAYGNADSPAKAIIDYIGQIRGKLLVVNAGDSENRRQYVVPKELTASIPLYTAQPTEKLAPSKALATLQTAINMTDGHVQEMLRDAYHGLSTTGLPASHYVECPVCNTPTRRTETLTTDAKDAARYRWLRKPSGSATKVMSEGFYGERLDEEIDAARIAEVGAPTHDGGDSAGVRSMKTPATKMAFDERANYAKQEEWLMSLRTRMEAFEMALHEIAETQPTMMNSLALELVSTARNALCVVRSPSGPKAEGGTK